MPLFFFKMCRPITTWKRGGVAGCSSRRVNYFNSYLAVFHPVQKKNFHLVRNLSTLSYRHGPFNNPTWSGFIPDTSLSTSWWRGLQLHQSDYFGTCHYHHQLGHGSYHGIMRGGKNVCEGVCHAYRWLGWLWGFVDNLLPRVVRWLASRHMYTCVGRDSHIIVTPLPSLIVVSDGIDILFRFIDQRSVPWLVTFWTRNWTVTVYTSGFGPHQWDLPITRLTPHILQVGYALSQKPIANPHVAF